MLNADRLRNYFGQAGYPADTMGGVTPRQATRLRHKHYSRKSHAHAYVTGWTCPRCKPGWIPARERRQQAVAGLQ